jgi:hypothetical protein
LNFTHRKAIEAMEIWMASNISSTLLDDDLRETVHQVLGNKTLFSVGEFAKNAGKSIPWTYRMMAAGLVPYVINGGRREVTRPVMVRVMTKGVGPARTRPRKAGQIEAIPTL